MYQTKLNFLETEQAIKHIKTIFELELSKKLDLLRVSAPLCLESNTGLNDNLMGEYIPVSFQNIEGETLEVVQSLAKWKRMALYRYELPVDRGIYADMNAIRPRVDIDELHSIYVDQWDWEKVIISENRTSEYLIEVVKKIYNALKNTEIEINKLYPNLKKKLPEEIVFVHTQELENMFPNLSPKEREYEITKCHQAVFLMGIGGELQSGEKHERRAPDYDDWELNGDILLYHEPLDKVLELSSMGIRVDSKTMKTQLTVTNTLDRMHLDYHKMVINNVLPLSIGGGIGQSRLSMYLLEKVHIGEVQVSVWPDNVIKECAYKRILLL